METCMEVINDAQRRGSDKYDNIKLVYSSPAAYFLAIQGVIQEEEEQTTGGRATNLPQYAGDFLPGAFSKHYVRSGYFSSRPAGKALDRIVWGNGDAAKRLRALASFLPPSDGTVVAQLDAAAAAVDASVGVHQHHDAISGTDFASVNDNYRDMMIGADELALPAAAAAAALLAGAATSPSAAREFMGCALANVSICEGTAALAEGKPVTLVLFNPLAGDWRTDVVAVPVPVGAVKVSGDAIEFEVHEAALAAGETSHPFTLFIKVQVPPLGTQRLVVSPLAGDAPPHGVVRFTPAPAGTTNITLAAPDGASATVDGTTGSLASVNGRATVSSLEYYLPEPGSNKSHGWGNTDDCSSAYAFRPQPGGTKPFLPTPRAVAVAKGKLVQQAYVQVSASASVELVVRVVAGDRSVRLITKIGALDVSNGVGQEAVMILEASGKNSAFDRTWWTDVNGLQMVKRVWRDNSTHPTTALGTPYVVWEPEAQNYYPATAMAALVSNTSTAGGALTVAFNAAHGVTSRRSSTLELMLHRRLVDHGCRVDEGFEMDDTHPVLFELRVRAPADGGEAAAAYRGDALRLLHPMQMYFGPSKGGYEKASAPAYLLPSNVHLHTLQALGTDLDRCDPFAAMNECADAIRRRKAMRSFTSSTTELIIRVQHLFAVGEDTTLSQSAVVDIRAFLASLTATAALPDGLVIKNAVETTLTAARVIDAAPKLGAFGLAPLEIRTLIVEVEAGVHRDEVGPASTK